MGKLPICLMLLLAACSHSMVDEKKLDDVKTFSNDNQQKIDKHETVKTVYVQGPVRTVYKRGPVKIIKVPQYIDPTGLFHPGFMEILKGESLVTTDSGPKTQTTGIDTATQTQTKNQNKGTEKLSFWSKLKTKTKLGLPWWSIIAIGCAIVGGGAYLFHHYTLAGRIAALWKKATS